MAHRAICLCKSLVQTEVNLWPKFAPLMVVGYMVRDVDQPFTAAFCILAAGTVPAILFARFCRAMGTVVAIRRSMTSLSLLDFWSSIWPRWSYSLGSITKLHCSYCTISMAGREFNSPRLSAEQLPVILKINLKPVPFSLPHTQCMSTHTKIPNQTMAKDTSSVYKLIFERP